MTARLAFALALVLTAVACRDPQVEEVESETIVPVTTAPATTGAIRAAIVVTGTVSAAPGAEQVVVAPLPGRIADIPKAEGDLVSAGEVLVRFEIPSLPAEVAGRGADLARARARVDNARAAQARATDLFDRGVAARKEVEDANREFADAQADVASAQAALAAAEASAALATVRARFSGVISKRLHNEGELVEASAGDPVLRVIDPRRLEVVAAVPISDMARVSVGAAGHSPSPDGEGEVTLQVVSRPATVDPRTATVQIRLALVTRATFAAGAPVDVRIDAEEHRNVVLVPTAAIVREADETAVFVADGNKARRRVVMLGLSDGMRVEIRDGLKDGELVIVTGQAGLPDGATITASGPGQ